MTPFFSIIIPLYNKAKYIETTLKSVLNQTFTNYEIIIVNDGSTDNSLNIVKSILDNRITIFSIKNQGVSVARNYGIRKASSNFVALLDADDYWYPFHLEEHKMLIDNYPDQYVFSSAQEFCKYGKYYKNSYSINFTNEVKYGIVDYFESSLINAIIHSSSVTINKNIFETVGLFNPNLKSGEDIDLWIRIGLKYKVVFNTKISSRYNYVAEGLFKSTKNINQKIDLIPYEILEKTNYALKKYLDINRYALAIHSKLWDDKKNFKVLKSKINLKKLNAKQRFLINQPKFVLKLLIFIKDYLMKIGISLSTYK